MMMNKYIFIVYSILLLLVSSCHSSSRYPEKILQAEQCMDTYPDSALMLLDSLQTTIFQEPKETQMYHHLLTIEARYKCYLPSTTDSLITIVADYYKKRDNRHKLLKAYYLKGCIYDELQDIPRALKCYQQALQISEGSKQYRTIALTYSQIGNVYLHQDMNKEAITMFKNTYDYYEQAKAPEKLLNPIRDIARAYGELEKKDSAIHYYKQAYQLAKKNENKDEENTLLNELGGYYIYNKEYKLASKTLRSCNNKQSNAKPNYISWGLFYQHTNRPDSAKYCFQKSLETKGTIYTTSGAYLHLAELEETAGNYKEAFRLLRTHQQWQDSIKKTTNTETAHRMHSMYNYQLTETENQKLEEVNTQKERWLYQIGIVAILIAVAGIRYWRHQKQKRQRWMDAEKRVHDEKEKQQAKSLERIELNEQEINDLKLKLSQSEKEKRALIEAEKRISDEKEKQQAKNLECIRKSEQTIDDLKLKLSQAEEEKRALVEAKIKSLEAANAQIRSEQEEKELKIKAFRKSDIYKQFHTEGLEEKHFENGEWTKLEDAIDHTYNNFTGKLYVLYPKISPTERHICCLIKIELSVTTISLLMGRSKACISSVRAKLYKKIQGKPHEKKEGEKNAPDLMDELLWEL